MKIAIQERKESFTQEWVRVCKDRGIEFVSVDVYAPNALEQIRTCDAFLWHWHHGSVKDWIFARQLLASLDSAGVPAFPDIRTCWHFDDKVGQKYLFEALDIPAARSWVFYDRESAMSWAEQSQWPKVFKLRGGAGSSNVKLVRSKSEARRIIARMFGRGYAMASVFGDIRTKVRVKKKQGLLLAKILNAPTIIRKLMTAKRMLPKQRGYVYFQEFIPGNKSDIRVVVIGERAFAIRRYCRPNDFRASGSGEISYDRNDMPLGAIRIALESAAKMKVQCGAFDFVRTADGRYLVIEVSYAFTAKAYRKCEGYWTRNMVWHDAPVTPEQWMLEDLIKGISQ